MLHVRLYESLKRLYIGEWNIADPGRPDTSIYFLARPNELSATQLKSKMGKGKKTRKYKS